jgi:hypothetical protein
VQQINTLKGPSDKSLFLHKTLPAKSTPPSPHYFIKKTLLKNISLVITIVIFMYVCVFHLSILVSVGPQTCSLLWYLKTWDSTQPYVAFSALEFRSCFFVFGGTHMAANSLALHKPVVDCDLDSRVRPAWPVACYCHDTEDRHKQECKIKEIHERNHYSRMTIFASGPLLH